LIVILPAHHNLNNQQLKLVIVLLVIILVASTVSVAGCLGYDVLVFTSSVLSATVAFQLLVV
jgi:hypothetical protein